MVHFHVAIALPAFHLLGGINRKHHGKIDLGDGVKISNVLLVEDSPGDVRLTQEAFRAANPSVSLHVANDGVEAMVFLRNQNGHASSPRPDMILLDLNMPRMDGRQVLAEIKKDDNLKTIPDRDSDHIGGGGRCGPKLSITGKLLPHQASATGRFRGVGEKHQ